MLLEEWVLLEGSINLLMEGKVMVDHLLEWMILHIWMEQLIKLILIKQYLKPQEIHHIRVVLLKKKGHQKEKNLLSE